MVARDDRLLTVALWLALLATDTITQIALKLGSGALNGVDFGVDWVTVAVASPWTWAAALSYLGAFVTWMMILRSTPLSMAFPLSAMAYPAVVAASWLLLGETVDALRWCGVAFIVAGVVLIGGESSDESGRG